MINYSIIIPHKNRADLLSRCLNALPRRDDLQIIIVDDNSDPNIVDFDSFPGMGDEHIEIYFTKEGKGAGYARNVGLLHSKGKWVVFADSDDFYLDNLNEMMDRFLVSEAEMIIFKQKRIDANGKDKPCHYDKYFDEAIATGNKEKLLLNYFCPIGRFIKKSFIDKYNIVFQEVRYSNDVLFILKCGLLARFIQVVNIPVYCVCETDNSLMRNKSWKNPYIRTKVALEGYSYVERCYSSINDDSWKWWWFSWWQKTFILNKVAAIYLLPKIVKTVGVKLLFRIFKNKLESLLTPLQCNK